MSLRFSDMIYVTLGRGNRRTRSLLCVIATCASVFPLVTCKQSRRIVAETIEVQIAERAGNGKLDSTVLLNGQEYLRGETLVRTRDVARAEASITQGGNPALRLQLTPTAGERMRSASARYLNKPLFVFVNGALVSAPIARSALGGEFLIDGSLKPLSASEINDLAKALNDQSGGVR